MMETPEATEPTTRSVDESAATGEAATDADIDAEDVEAAIPAQQDGEAMGATDTVETVEEVVAEGKPEEKPEDKADDKSKSKRPKKSAPRKAAGTKTLVVLREGRVQYADADTVLVIDLDEAASADTDVHDVVDKLAELRDAVDSEGKSDAVKALTELIQEKALGS